MCGRKGKVKDSISSRFKRSLRSDEELRHINPIRIAIVRGKVARYGEWPWAALVDLCELYLCRMGMRYSCDQVPYRAVLLTFF